MANLAFELGFDWNVHPVIGVRDGVYPLQICLVNEDDNEVISPYCDSDGSWSINVNDHLYFHLYDFTDYGESPPDNYPVPTCMQILCSDATDSTENFTPFLGQGDPVAQQASTNFNTISPSQSIAFDSTAPSGWKAQFPTSDIGFNGCFNLRVLLTVGIPGELPGFYRADLGMAVGPQTLTVYIQNVNSQLYLQAGSNDKVTQEKFDSSQGGFQWLLSGSGDAFQVQSVGTGKLMYAAQAESQTPLKVSTSPSSGAVTEWLKDGKFFYAKSTRLVWDVSSASTKPGKSVQIYGKKSSNNENQQFTLSTQQPS